MPFDGAGDVPAAGGVGGEAEEAAVIFGVADHHHRGVACGFDKRDHEPATDTAALDVRIDRDRADEGKWGGAKADQPALKAADESLPVECRETQAGNCRHPLANSVGGAGVTVCAERGIEERFDSVRIGVRQGGNRDRHGGRANSVLFSDWKPGCFALGARAMNDLLQLEVRDLDVPVLTGIYSEETHLPQPLRISVIVDLDVQDRFAADTPLGASKNYMDLKHAAMHLPEGVHFVLIEAVADHIAETLMADDARVARVEVRIVKLAIAEAGESIGIRRVKYRR